MIKTILTINNKSSGFLCMFLILTKAKTRKKIFWKHIQLPPQQFARWSIEECLRKINTIVINSEISEMDSFE